MAAVLGRGFQRGIQSVGGASEDGSSRGCVHSTFAAYYIVTISLNSVAILAGVFSQFDFHRQSNYNRFDRMDAWYFANAVFGILHILACFYIVYAIERPNRPTEWSANQQTASAFDYNNLPGKVDVPPPPKNPYHIQADEVVVVGVESSPKPNPWALGTQPSSWARIAHVLTEDKFVAVYILVFAFYLAWHFFMDTTHMKFYYNPGMHFVMRCADIFIMAGPASLVFSIGYTVATR
jgi:hypothetical protein